MTTNRANDSLSTQGHESHRQWRDELRSHAEYQSIYDEESAKSELWLQLTEARNAAGLTRAELAKRLEVSTAQVPQIEERGYDTCTLSTLRRYVEALGNDLTFELSIKPTHVS